MGVPLFTTECPQGVYQIAFEITEDMICLLYTSDAADE